MLARPDRRPNIVTYDSADKKKKMDIISFGDVPATGLTTFATIGLNRKDIALTYEERSIRIELVGLCDTRYTVQFAHLMSSAAFEIFDMQTCRPGTIIPGAAGAYVPDSDMKHILLKPPFAWDDWSRRVRNFVIEDRQIEWLMPVPISQAEAEFLRDNGADKLDDLFVEKNVDIANLLRQSAI